MLILQPWGWRYRGMTDQGHPTEESTAQLEFYYAKLKWAQGEAWMNVAERFAEGEKWPSVQELRQALQHINVKYVQALPQPEPELVPMPDDVREALNRFVGRDL